MSTGMERAGASPILTRLAAYGVIRRDGAVLLCRIAADYPDAGAFTLPGGAIEFGETPEEAVLREVEEETGLRVEITGPARIFTDAGLTRIAGENRRYHQVRFVYPVAVIGGTERVEVGNSTDGFEWIEASRLAHERLVPLVELALDPADQPQPSPSAAASSR